MIPKRHTSLHNKVHKKLRKCILVKETQDVSNMANCNIICQRCVRNSRSLPLMGFSYLTTLKFSIYNWVRECKASVTLYVLFVFSFKGDIILVDKSLFLIKQVTW